MLSDRVRPGVEAAPWVVEAIKALEQELRDVHLEMAKVRPDVKAVFDRDVRGRVEAARKEKLK